MNVSLTGVVRDGTGTTQQVAQSVRMPAGESFVVTLDITGQDGTPFPLTGYTSILSVRRSLLNSEDLFQRAGVNSLTTGRVTFTGAKVDTVDADPHDYVFDIWITETATDKSYCVLPERDVNDDESTWTIEDAVVDLGDPVTAAPPDMLIIAVPAPSPSDVGKAIILVDDDPAAVDFGTPAAILPDQTGHSGEFLTTDGVDASWGPVDLPAVANVAGAVIVEDPAGTRTARRLTEDDIDPAFAVAFSSGPTATVEAGGSVVNPQFVVTYNQTPSSASVTGPDSVAHTITPASDTTIGYGGAYNNFPAQTFTDPGTTLNNTFDFVYAATYNGVSDSATYRVSFRRRCWYGMAAIATYNEAFIEALSTSRLQSTALSATAGTYAFAAGNGSTYAHVALETGWADPTSFLENNTGLDSQWTKVAADVAVTNANGVALSYDIWRAPLANTDAFTYRAV